MFTFFFKASATTEIYTLSLHDALPISAFCTGNALGEDRANGGGECPDGQENRSAGRRISLSLRYGTATRTCGDRKSTRLNSSHTVISYAVFCLKKKST